MSMIRDLDDKDELVDAIHIHSAQQRGRRHLRRRAAQARPSAATASSFIETTHGGDGPLQARRPRRAVPDWNERLTFASGPGELLDALCEHWEEHGDQDLLNIERFQPTYGEGGEEGEGGTVKLHEVRQGGRGRRRPVDPRGRRGGGARPRLRLPHGHLPHVRRASASGKIRDLRSGEVTTPTARRSVSASTRPRAHVEVEL